MNQVVLVKENVNTGELVTFKKVENKEGEVLKLGTIMVSQETFTGFSGIARVSRRVAFITVEEKMANALLPSLRDNSPFPVNGKIIIKETTTPYVRKDGSLQSPKINPTTGEVITYNGNPVYRNTQFTEDLSAVDVFLRDNNVDEEATE